MDFGLTEEQELLLENLKDLVDQYWDEEEYNDCYYNRHCHPPKFMQALLDNGYSTLGVPEEYGGTPVDLQTLVMFGIELAHYTGAWIPAATNGIAIDDILAVGSDWQKEFVLNYVVEHGRNPFALAFTEPQAGSDSSAILSTFTRRDGKVYVNGHKTMITGADESPYMMVCTRDLEAADPKKAVTTWLVPTDAPGVRIEHLHKIGLQTASFCEVYMEDVEIEEKNMLGKEGEGFMVVMKNFEIERLMLVAVGVGLAKAAFDDAVNYANAREQFGKPIGQFQLIQEKITDMAIKIKNMENFLMRTAWKKENGISVQLDSALAKRYCAQASMEVVDECMQIMGGLGYTRECRISRMWLDCRHLRLAGGTDEIMVHIAGRKILKEYAKGQSIY